MSLQSSIRYPPQACKKIKRYLPEMVGEKREKWACLSYFVTTLEHDTFIHLGWEILCLTVDQTSLTFFSRVMGINFESFVTKPSVVSLCVQEVWTKTFNCKIPIFHHIIIESVLTATFLQLELWFRVVGLPATSRFLSTSAHYLESWLRNCQYLEICMPQW